MRRYFRAYPAISSRQQGADRLVYNETDLRTVLWQAVDPAFEGERPSTIRLAADIYLTKPIELGAYDYSVTIEGAGKYKIAHSAEYSHGYVFGLPPLADGTVYNVTFSGVEFSLKIANDIFGGDRSSTVHDFNVHECTVTSDSLTVPSSSFVFDSTVNATSSNIQFDEFSGISLGAARFSGLFEAGGLDGVHVGPTLYHYRDSDLIFSRSLSGVRCGTGNTSELSLRVDGGAKIIPHSITLSGSNPSIDVGNKSCFDITIDNATATGTMTMTAGQTGQIVVLYFQDTATHMVVDDTLTMNVGKNYHAKKPNQDETISFIYINGKWQELCRSENT
jgi:hypothetical protein